MNDRPAPLDRLRTRVARLGAPLCLGIDPHPDSLPDELPRDASGIERFARGLIEAAAEYAVAVKINVAFFEAFGSAGWAALERVVADVPPDHFLLLDAKRGDIGSTAERYAASLFGLLGADAVTLSPYLGEDSVEPFLAYPDRLVYLVTRTTNPSAGTLQDLPVGGAPLHEHVATWAAGRWTDGRVGLVVGATAPAELARLRRLVPALGFLVPGVGAQDGDLAAAVANCDGTAAPGLVSISRAIAAASQGDGWRAAAAVSAQSWLGRMQEAGATLPA
jgi:orotidine 5'-phosphate decarboxylase subfamily 2